MLTALEALSYVVTVVGLPFALWVFMQEQRKEREKDDEEIYLELADDYESFLKLTLKHADLRLLAPPDQQPAYTDEQRERKHVLFEILIAQFERAYILVYEQTMSHQAARLWQTWDDYIRSWCRRSDFRAALDKLLEGEDADFQGYIRTIAAEEAARTVRPSESAANPEPPHQG